MQLAYSKTHWWLLYILSKILAETSIEVLAILRHFKPGFKANETAYRIQEMEGNQTSDSTAQNWYIYFVDSDLFFQINEELGNHQLLIMMI